MSNSNSSKSKTTGSQDSNNSNNYDDRDIDWTYEYINEYLLLTKLGQGAYCSVWFAFNINTNIYCALKVYCREDFERGKKEITVYDKLKNLNINNIILYNNSFEYEDINERGVIFLCSEMPLCGYSVYDLIEIYDNKIPPEIIYKITQEVIKTLSELHKHNYVHADIKPENILLKNPKYEIYQMINIINIVRKKYSKINKKNKQEFTKAIKKALENKILDDSQTNIQNYILKNHEDIYLCDMGTTVQQNDPKLFSKYTIYYRAPETILKLNYTNTYDYWSLGCSLYEIITGEILFDVENDLELLYEFTSQIGPLPNNLLEESKHALLFYNKKLTRLRGYKEIKINSIYQKLLNLLTQENFIIMHKLISIIISCLDYNYKTRNIQENIF